MSSSTLETTIQGSVLRLVVFGIEAQQYALALSAVDRAFPMVAVSPLPKAPAIALGVINISGRVIPVMDIRKRFGLPARALDLGARLLVARTPRRILAMPVDTVIGVTEIMAGTVTAPDAVLPGIGHVAGIVTLPDGLLFIHDLDTFLSLDEERQLATALAEVTG